MGLSLTTATSLVANFPGNNTFNDVSGNSNTMTAVNGAIATQTANPFSAIEYAFITGVSYSGGVTTVTLFSGDNVIPNMTVTSALYSTANSPVGFPMAKNRWRITVPLVSPLTVTSNALYDTFINGAWNIVVPQGSWNIGWEAGVYTQTTTPVGWNLSATPLTGLTLAQGSVLSRYAFSAANNGSASTTTYPVRIDAPQQLANAATYTMYTIGTTTSAGVDAGASTTELFAECTYL